MALLFKVYVEVTGFQHQTQQGAVTHPSRDAQNLYGNSPWKPPTSQEDSRCTSPNSDNVRRTCSFRQNRRRQPWERQSSNPPSNRSGSLQVETSPASFCVRRSVSRPVYPANMSAEFGNHRRSASLRVPCSESRPVSPSNMSPEFGNHRQSVSRPVSPTNWSAQIGSSPVSPQKVNNVNRTCSFRKNRRRQPWERQSANPPFNRSGSLQVETSPAPSGSFGVRRTASQPVSPANTSPEFGEHRQLASLRARRTKSSSVSPANFSPQTGSPSASPNVSNVRRTCSFRENRRRQPWERQTENQYSGCNGSVRRDKTIESVYFVA